MNLDLSQISRQISASRRLERVVVINDSSIARGGATALALLSANLLSERNIPVSFITGDVGIGAELPGGGIDQVTLGGRRLMEERRMRAVVSGIYNRPARDLLARWISENDNPGTVYHLHGWSKILSPAIVEALRPVAARTVLHAHDFFLACPNGGFVDYRDGSVCTRQPLSLNCLSTNCDKRSYGQKLWRVMRQVALHRLLAGAHWAQVVVIHERMIAGLKTARLPADGMTAVRNPTAPLTEERVNVEENSEFLFVGRVETEKGVTDAIAAAGRAEVPLRVVGDGPLLARLVEAFPEVTFDGWLTRSELALRLKRARVLVMPSRYPEPYGLVAAEAARAGVPAILSRTAFLSDEFESLGIGKSCDTADIGALTSAMRAFRDMPREEIREMSRLAQHSAGEVSTTPEEWIAKLIGIYSDVVDAAASN